MLAGLPPKGMGKLVLMWKDRGKYMELGAEHLAELRRGIGLKLLLLSDLSASLLFKFINPELSSRDKPQRTIT